MQATMQGERSSEVYRADLLHYTEVPQDISQQSKQKPPANSKRPPLKAQQQSKQLNKEFLSLS